MLVPVLAAIAAVIFLLAGYLLKALAAARPLADALIAFGWFFASVMALGIVAAGVGLLITAVRNASTQIRSAGTESGEPGELVEARAEWRAALLERGIVPYLRRMLVEAEGPTAFLEGAPFPDEDTRPSGSVRRVGTVEDGRAPGGDHDGPGAAGREAAPPAGAPYPEDPDPAAGEHDREGDRGPGGDQDARTGHGWDRGQERRPAPARGDGAGRNQAARHQFPKIGYSRPNYSSPGGGASGGRGPRYSSPDFSSPDYGGPDHQPE
ncbi:hypothetical protein [Streptomyces fuscigenes]|uniref:hypothetical protein n=1 Tax=Streptomyces fuscigenes TaxID=1528880 RepID=UPI001F2187D6|nr:hypothetical protein [Streptomyces fuscigenes]MCF3961282.1 hypothetical protein [Streptomyces fuscigenes]